MKISRGLGWLPDVPKCNDYHPYHPAVLPLLERTALAPQAGAARADPIPASVDLRTGFSPVEDQGTLGSCTAQAAIALVEYFERRASGSHVDASSLFVYKTERNLLGWRGDTGAYLRTAMQALVLFGAPPERYWPYDVSRFDEEPSPFCYAFSQNFKAIRYFRLDPGTVAPAQVLANVKRFVAKGFPCMFGFPVYSDYENPSLDAHVPFPRPESAYCGGHANVAAGYDDNLMIGNDKGALLVRNSWGTGWGAGGYGWLSYRYVTEGLATDWWSITRLDWVETGKF